MKTCTRCKEEKPHDSFYVRSASKDGLSFWCKGCHDANKARLQAADPEKHRAYHREWYARNRDRHRQQGRVGHLRRKFKMTETQYQDMLAAQGGTCAICDSVFADDLDRRLCVDHSHETGEVRGLLCTRCNRILGMARDDAALLRKAARYLR